MDDGVKLVGWWEPEPLVTVTENSGNSSTPLVFASVYVRTSPLVTAGAESKAAASVAAMPKAVISVASWAHSGTTSCTLNIDWAKLGLSAAVSGAEARRHARRRAKLMSAAAAAPVLHRVSAAATGVCVRVCVCVCECMCLQDGALVNP